MKLWHTIMLAILSLFAADIANAQEPAPTPVPAPAAGGTAPAPDPVQAELEYIRRHPISIRTGANFFGGTVRSTNFMRGDLSLGVGFDISRYLTLYSNVHFGTTRFHYEGNIDDGLAVRGTVWSYFDTSLSAGAEVHALRMRHFELDLFGEFEVSFARTTPEVTELRMTTDQGTYDIGPYARENTQMGLFWYRLAVGPTARLRFGPVLPFLTVAFEHIHATMDLGLTDPGRTVVSRLGYNVSEVERSHELSFFHVALTPGVGFQMSQRDRLTVAGTFVPGDWHYGGSLLYAHRF